jgi:endonuclease/exonuclease/phosphatase family metal-dependent hydrolase
MHAGRGDLPRLVRDLQSGAVTDAPLRDYVVLLQEAIEGGRHDVIALARATGLSATFIPVRTTEDRTSGNAILSTRQLLNVHGITLPRQRQPRGAIAAAIVVDGHRFFLVDAHFENRGGGIAGPFVSDAARTRQARALLDELPSREPGILGGDLNTWLGPNEPAWRLLAERFDDTPRRHPGPTFRNRLTLDHLFFDLPDGWRASTRVLDDAYGSDHHPVLGLLF